MSLEGARSGKKGGALPAGKKRAQLSSRLAGHRNRTYAGKQTGVRQLLQFNAKKKTEKKGKKERAAQVAQVRARIH